MYISVVNHMQQHVQPSPISYFVSCKTTNFNPQKYIPNNPASLDCTTILLYRYLTSYRVVAAKICFSSCVVTDNDFTNVTLFKLGEYCILLRQKLWCFRLYQSDRPICSVRIYELIAFSVYNHSASIDAHRPFT